MEHHTGDGSDVYIDGPHDAILRLYAPSTGHTTITTAPTMATDTVDGLYDGIPDGIPSVDDIEKSLTIQRPGIDISKLVACTALVVMTAVHGTLLTYRRVHEGDERRFRDFVILLMVSQEFIRTIVGIPLCLVCLGCIRQAGGFFKQSIWLGCIKTLLFAVPAALFVLDGNLYARVPYYITSTVVMDVFSQSTVIFTALMMPLFIPATLLYLSSYRWISLIYLMVGGCLMRLNCDLQLFDDDDDENGRMWVSVALSLAMGFVRSIGMVFMEMRLKRGEHDALSSQNLTLAIWALLFSSVAAVVYAATDAAGSAYRMRYVLERSIGDLCLMGASGALAAMLGVYVVRAMDNITYLFCNGISLALMFLIDRHFLYISGNPSDTDGVTPFLFGFGIVTVLASIALYYKDHLAVRIELPKCCKERPYRRSFGVVGQDNTCGGASEYPYDADSGIDDGTGRRRSDGTYNGGYTSPADGDDQLPWVSGNVDKVVNGGTSQGRE